MTETTIEHNINDLKGKQVFYVLGMHRSGTSFLSELLSKLGLQLPKSIGGAAEDNERGFFEPLDLVTKHNQWFQKHGLRWDRVLPLSGDILKQDSKLTSETIKEVFAQNYFVKAL